MAQLNNEYPQKNLYGAQATDPSRVGEAQLPEIDEEGKEDNNGDQGRPPRPFLRRKTKAVKVERSQQYKPLGKSRIDCWQRDRDENKRGKKKQRQSLLKKNQESATKRLDQPYQNQQPFGHYQQNQMNRLPGQNHPAYAGELNQYLTMDDTDMESAIPDEDFQEENDFAGMGMRGAVASSGMLDPFANQQQYRRNAPNAFDNDLSSAGAVVG